MTVEVKLDGLDGILDALKKLGKEASKRGGPARKALFQGAKVIRDAARQGAPVDTGALKKNIVAARDRRPESDGASEQYFVGVKGGARKPYANSARNRRSGKAGGTYQTQGSTYYWRFLEFGTAKMPPVPFLVPAFEQNKEAALAAIVKSMRVEVDKIAARVGK